MLIAQILAAVFAWRKGWGLLVLLPFGLGLLTGPLLGAVPGLNLPAVPLAGTGDFVCLVALLLMNCVEGPWASATAKA
jgi:hypothetical protein